MLKRIAVVLVVTLAVSPVIAQTTTQDVSKKTAEAWNTVRSYTVEKKDEAAAYGRKLVRETDHEIGALERKAAKASGEAKAEFKSDVKELKAKRAEASKKLDEMGRASGGAWDEAKNGFADAYRDLHRAYDRAVDKLK